MRKVPYLVVIVLCWYSCSLKEESVSFDSNLELFFSNDSVAFDTLLTDSRSSTQRLTIFNPNEAAIQLSRIALGLGSSSDYSVVINGRSTDELFNEQILGSDSLLVLVEVDISPRNRNLPYLVKDSLIVEWNGNSKHVKFVTYGQDGIRKKNQVVCDEVWTRERPYIVSDTLLVPPGCQLTIEPGARVLFENDAVMLVQGTLTANGTSDARIEFRNTRFDGIYDEVPGQWNGIYFLQGSQDNLVTHANIYNAQIGLSIGFPGNTDVPDLTVRSSKIYNMSFAGLLGFTSQIDASNLLIYNCGTYLVGNFAGGDYSYNHCTLVNDPSFFVRDEPSVQFSDNLVLENDEVITRNLRVNATNCIIWGSGEEELLISQSGGTSPQAEIVSNIIRSASELEGNFTSLDFDFPGFTDPFSFNYTLDTLAFAKDKGIPTSLLKDLNGNDRDAKPDIGAFERIEK
ncbi:MAG: hypothetical protein Tsb0034_14420 [Ekhidna sp.]